MTIWDGIKRAGEIVGVLTPDCRFCSCPVVRPASNYSGVVASYGNSVSERHLIPRRAAWGLRHVKSISWLLTQWNPSAVIWRITFASIQSFYGKIVGISVRRGPVSECWPVEPFRTDFYSLCPVISFSLGRTSPLHAAPDFVKSRSANAVSYCAMFSASFNYLLPAIAPTRNYSRAVKLKKSVIDDSSAVASAFPKNRSVKALSAIANNRKALELLARNICKPLYHEGSPFVTHYHFMSLR